MNAMIIALIAFTCVFGAALMGMLLRRGLPEHHLSQETKDVVKLGVGLIGTMSALVLGLLTASAKNYFDTQANELTEMSSKIVYLDRILALYGPETKDVREILRTTVGQTLNRISPSDPSQLSMTAAPGGSEIIFSKIQALSPKNDSEQGLKSQALNMVINLGQERWLMFTQGSNSISTPLLVIVIFWLSLIFLSFGLFAPFNTTVISTFFFSGLSVSASIFLILEMYQPFEGLIHISSAPLQNAFMHLGQ